MNAQTSAALFTLLLSSFALHAAELAESPVETITWVSILPARPAGKEASSSEDPLSDRIQPFVAQHWPQVKHVVVQANPRRIWRMIGNGDKVCQVPSIRTPEREKIAYFSNTFLGPPMQLIVHRDLLPRLPRNAQGEVELAKLLANTELHGALIDGRSYGGFIDAQLARMPHRGSSLTRYSAADYGSKLLPMLGKGRMDYTIDYEVGIARRAAWTRTSAISSASPLRVPARRCCRVWSALARPGAWRPFKASTRSWAHRPAQPCCANPPAIG